MIYVCGHPVGQGNHECVHYYAQVGGEMSDVKATRVSMRMRDYIEPLFVIAAVEICSRESGSTETDGPAMSQAQQPANPQGLDPSTSASHDTRRKGVDGSTIGEGRAQLPENWLGRGCVVMSEERLPDAANGLKVAVSQKLHPKAPSVRMMRSPAPTKLWGEIDLRLHEPQVSHGPSLGPAINMISMVIAGLSPPSSESPGPQPKPLMSWDKARLMMHGKVRLHMDRACLRLLADPSPYSNAECFQLRGEPITIFYVTKNQSTARQAETRSNASSAQHHSSHPPKVCFCNFLDRQRVRPSASACACPRAHQCKLHAHALEA